MINVTKTYLPDKEKFQAHVDDIFASGWITNRGEKLLQLEELLKEYLQVEHLLVVSNGTLALQICYRALGLTGEVITSPFSFVATTSTLVWEHLKPVFADVDPCTFNIDPEKIVPLITDNTSAVLPVHVFGNPCEVERLEEICAEHRLKLIFDAAHAFDVHTHDRNVLSYGDASILSFHATKIFHTIEGGAIVFKRKEDLEKARLLINFGIADYDKIDTLGINCKMNEFQAAMGLTILPEMSKISKGRSEVWNRYIEAFTDTDHLQLQQFSDQWSKNYSYFPVVLKSEAVLLKLRKALQDAGIYPRRYFYPSLNLLSYLPEYFPCPVSEDIANRILCLPIFPDLDTEVQHTIISIVKNNLQDS